MCGTVTSLVCPVIDTAPTESPKAPASRTFRKDRYVALASTFVVHIGNNRTVSMRL